MNIKVLEIRRGGNSKTRAFVDVGLNDIVFKDFRVLEEHGKPHVKIPYLTYRTPDGRIRFRDILVFPSRLKEEIDAVILSAFFRWERAGKNGQAG